MGCHSAPPRVTVSVLSTVTAAVITQIGEEKKKLQHSWSVTGAGFVWAECELDSLIPGWMWRDLRTQEFSPLLMLSCHQPHPSPHPRLDLPLVLNRGSERRWEGRDALEVRRSMRWSEGVSGLGDLQVNGCCHSC